MPERIQYLVKSSSSISIFQDKALLNIENMFDPHPRHIQVFFLFGGLGTGDWGLASESSQAGLVQPHPGTFRPSV